MHVPIECRSRFDANVPLHQEWKETKQLTLNEKWAVSVWVSAHHCIYDCIKSFWVEFSSGVHLSLPHGLIQDIFKAEAFVFIVSANISKRSFIKVICNPLLLKVNNQCIIWQPWVYNKSLIPQSQNTYQPQTISMKENLNLELSSNEICTIQKNRIIWFCCFLRSK